MNTSGSRNQAQEDARPYDKYVQDSEGTGVSRTRLQMRARVILNTSAMLANESATRVKGLRVANTSSSAHGHNQHREDEQRSECRILWSVAKPGKGTASVIDNFILTLQASLSSETVKMSTLGFQVA